MTEEPVESHKESQFQSPSQKPPVFGDTSVEQV